MTVASIGNYTKRGFIRKKALEKVCLEQKEKLAIKTPSMNQLIKNLSGGNQQKVLVARWLMTNPEILIVDEPTRGIDVGAKAEIHRLLSMMAKGRPCHYHDLVRIAGSHGHERSHHGHA